MNDTANGTNCDGRSLRISRRMAACVALLLIPLLTNAAFAAPEDEVRATFERFVAAQNAHDVKAVESFAELTRFSLDNARDAGVGIGRGAKTLQRAP